MGVVDDIKARLDIAEAVSGYVTLQKSGRNFKAPCPFHTEKTPSFVVSPERQSWRCFGACGTGGDVFSFVMRIEGLDFGGVLRLLAQRTGVTLTQRRDSDRTEGLYRINEVAARFYQEVLESSRGQAGGEYLEERGVDAGARSRFGLGLSPGDWDGLKSHLQALGLAEELAVEAGLVHRGEDGRTWDFFRGRLMFPIHDRRGRVAGFGARAIDHSSPKYMNTSKTPIFDKGSTLYGLHLAAESIGAQGTGIVVEGYMDVIAAHQHGYTNVVASMGTALTEQQVSQLKSLANDFVQALDPDAAGQEATLRSLESSWRAFEGRALDDRRRSVGALYQREPLTLKIAALPAGRDPDELIREDPGEWERLTRDAVPSKDFYISAVASRFDLATSQGRAQAAQVLVRVITSADFVEQEHYVRKVAQAVGVSQEALKAGLGGLLARGPRRSQRGGDPSRAAEVSTSALLDDAGHSLEDYTLSLLLNRPELRERADGLAPENFHKTEDRELFTRWLSCSTMDELQESLDESLHEHMAQLTRKELVSADLREIEAALAQCIRRLEKRHLLELQEALLACDDTKTPPDREIEGAVVKANAKIKELSS